MASRAGIVLMAFLGNPGREYAQTRHNMAWMVADRLSALTGVSWQSKFNGRYAKAVLGGDQRICLRPETFMNLSGQSVRAALQFFKASPESLLVVHDDLELQFGELAYKWGGGLGGHNGLRSIADQLGTRDFYRLRLGIGRPVHGTPSDHVLGRFSKDESAVLPLILDRAADLLEAVDRITDPQYRFEKLACL